MLLGDNYGVTIYKNSRGTTATPFSNKVSVEILDRVFFQMAFTDKQAIVTPLNIEYPCPFLLETSKNCKNWNRLFSYQDGHRFIPQVRFLNSRLIAFNW